MVKILTKQKKKKKNYAETVHVLWYFGYLLEECIGTL